VPSQGVLFQNNHYDIIVGLMSGDDSVIGSQYNHFNINLN
jgi:hypothetical protein